MSAEEQIVMMILDQSEIQESVGAQIVDGDISA